MNKIILILSILFLSSCKKGNVQVTKVIPIQSINDSIAVSKIVLNEGTLFIPDWVELSNFQEELKSISNQNITTEKELEQLINLLTKLKETIPEKYKTAAIAARIKVLETELLMMNQFVMEQDFKQSALRKLNTQKAYNLVINQIEALLIKEKDYEKYK